MFLLTRIAAPDATFITVDLPGGPFGEGYPEWMSPMMRSFAKPEQIIRLLRVDSHSPDTLADIQRILDGREVDLLFIDGDHRYEGVKRDFEMYSGLVRRGCPITFHDIVPGDPEIVGGVPRFWEEVKGEYESAEFVKDWNQGGFGIGLIRR